MPVEGPVGQAGAQGRSVALLVEQVGLVDRLEAVPQIERELALGQGVAKGGFNRGLQPESRGTRKPSTPKGRHSQAST